MRFYVITILKNRSDLTLDTLISFYKTNDPLMHIFIDNASTDDTQQVIRDAIQDLKDAGVNTVFYYFRNDENMGIAKALSEGIKFVFNKEGKRSDTIFLKLDNDIRFDTDNLLEKVEKFYEANGSFFVVAPRDRAIDPAYEPKEVKKSYKLPDNFTSKTHVGGACLFIPPDAARILAYQEVEKDVNRGHVLRANGYVVGYLDDMFITHMGLNRSVDNYRF